MIVKCYQIILSTYSCRFKDYIYSILRTAVLRTGSFVQMSLLNEKLTQVSRLNRELVRRYYSLLRLIGQTLLRSTSLNRTILGVAILVF